MARLASWCPPLLWMAAILWFSTGDFSAERTGGLLEPLLRWLVPSLTAAHIHLVHGLVRKAGHLTVYGILASLWLRAFLRERIMPITSASWSALAITVAWACVDELHQATLATRTGSAMDVALDAAGAATVLLLARAASGSPARRRRFTP